MLTWPHSGFQVHTAVWVSEDDRACATRLARCCARDAPSGRADRGGDAGRDRPRATARVRRGHPPVGGGVAAVFRGLDPLACPSCHGAMRLVACITQRSAIDQILAHLPHPRRDDGPRRRAESALDPGTIWTGRHATTGRGPPGPLSLTPTPRSRAGTFGVRVSPAGASDPSPLSTGRPQKTPPGRPSRRGGGQAAARPPALAGSAIAPYVRRILDRARLNFLFRADELMTQLAEVPELRVATRTSVRAFADSSLTPTELGARLDVRALVEGSVQRAKNQLRVTTRLVDVRDGSTLWSDRYERTTDDLFAVQREIGSAVVADREFDLALARQPDLGATHQKRAELLYTLGRVDDAVTGWPARRALLARGSATGTALAKSGDALPDSTMARLERAVTERDPIMWQIPLRLWWFDRMCDAPAFARLAQRLKLPAQALEPLPAPGR